MKNKKKILISSFILILMVSIVVLLFNTSNGNSTYELGVLWKYEESNGEATKVNAVGGLFALYDGMAYNTDTNSFELDGNGNPITMYPYYYFDDNIVRAIEIPSYLNGLPVTEITGKNPVNGWNAFNFINIAPGDHWTPYAPSDAIDTNDTQTKIEKVILPNTLKKIGHYAFLNFNNLKELEFPDSLERIETSAFEGSKIENVELDGLVHLGKKSFERASTKTVRITNTQKIDGFGNCNELTTITIGQGVQQIDDFGYCPSATNVHIGSDLRKLNLYAFRGMKDIYVAVDEEDVELYNRRTGAQDLGEDQLAYIHFNNHEKIDVDVPEGVKIIDNATGEEFTSKKFATGSDVTIRLEKEEGYEFDDYVVYTEFFGDYYNSPKVVEKINLTFGETYTISDLQRAGTIHFQNRKDGLDLSLRQYIKSINGEELAKTREPVTEITYGKPAYKHTKENIYPKNGDRITYAIRVYNEGTVDGKATQVKDYIPQGLKFAEDSEINTLYGWIKSDDGRTATTSYLNNKEIEKYTVYDIKYEEIYIDLIVDIEESQEMTRLVNMATIMEDSGDDVDSTPGEVENPNDAEYKREESETSTPNSYIAGEEDDNDFENVYTSYSVPLPYSLLIKKIDGIDSQYLNGATFDLLDSDKNVVKTGVTANGGVLDFGSVYTFGIGTTTFYVRETYTPEGYRNHLKYLVQVDLINEYDIATGLNTRVELDIKDIDIDTSIYDEIEISTKEQLRAIENDSDKKYVLTQDINLGGENWTPLNVSNVKLDGKGHKITGLKIDSTDETTKKFGLFGTYSGIIENLTLENVDIDVTKYVDPNATEGDEPAEETEADIDAVGAFIGYAENTIIKNCKVTGTIDTGIRNVGGFVGHTKEGKIIVSRDNTNEATITANGHNVGGFLGCGLGPVKVYNTVNNGTINAESYNAGGIIGCVIPNRYELTQVFANYDLDNKIATLAIKNDAIKSKYQFKLEKTDVSGNLLDGAKFQILDNNKQVIEGMDAVEVDNGVLSLDKTIIDSIGSDVYYLKEVEAPEGYEKLTNQYIKLIISKKWNKENAEYYIEASLDELTEDELEEDEILSRNTSEVKTGLTYERQEENVKWNIYELDMENSRNTAEVNNEYEITVTGGLVGSSQGRTLITNSVNAEKVDAKGGFAKTAGIIGQITKKDEDNKAYITNCKNTAIVNGHAIKATKTTSWGSTQEDTEGSTSGIVAYSITDLHIDKCTNENRVHGCFTASAGILTKGLDDIVITDCTNKGQVEGDIDLEEIPLQTYTGSNYSYQYRTFDISESEVGGIMAENTRIEGINEDKPLNITGCTNEGDVSGYNHVAGILANTTTNLLNVEDCETKDCNVIGKTAIKPEDEPVDNHYASLTYENNIGNGVASGIVGIAFTEDIYISNSKVTNAQVKNERRTGGTNSKTAGILAAVNTYGLYKSSSVDHIILNITGCNVDSSDVISEIGDTSGVVAFLGYGPAVNNGNITNIIKDCNISKSNIKCNTPSGSTSVTGIAGQGYRVRDVEIENCNLTETNITYSDEENASGTPNVGGLFGFNWCTGGGESVEIKNCTIDQVNIKSYNGSSTSRSDSNTSFGMAGIYLDGNYYNENAQKVILNNIKVINSELFAKGGNASGIYNITAGGGSYNLNNYTDVKDCLVENTKISVIDTERENWTSASVGGIVGETNLYADMDNCIVRNCEILGEAVSNIGGLVGNSLNNCTIKITNSDVIDTDVKLSRLGRRVGGIAGEIGSTMYIENCNVKGVNKRIKLEGVGEQLGGITGTIHTNYGDQEYPIIIKDCTVENADMTYSGNGTYCACGGILAGSNYVAKIANCTNKNCTITSNAIFTAGIIGYEIQSNAVIEGCTVEDGKIIQNANTTTSNGRTTNNQTNTAGIEAYNYGSKVDNCTVKNFEIEAKGLSNVGGVIGFTREVQGSLQAPVQNTEITGITINNDGSGVNGGIVGLSEKNITFEDINISNINITGKGHDGGLAGLVANSSIKNVNATDITIKATASNSSCYGGFIGLVLNGFGSYTNLENTTIEDSSITRLKIETVSGAVGGLIGEAMNPIVTDVTLTDINISNSGKTGGMIGIVTKPSGMSSADAVAMSEFNNVTINKSASGVNTISGNNEHTGMILGLGKVKVTIANISDVTINGNNSTSTGTVGLAETANSNLTGITLNRITMSANRGYAGLVAGVSAGNISSCNVSNSTITSNGSETGGIVGIQVKPSASGDIVKNCNVTDVAITGVGHVGGIAGFSGNNISECIVTDSSVTGTASGVGGILGHGSNYAGTDVAITNSKVITTNITGTSQVGGISGGALVTVKDCYVGGKEGRTYTQDEPAVTITGTDGVGGIIGDAGVVSADSQSMITIKDNTIQDTKIERNARAKLAGESDDEHKMIGIHNSFGNIRVNGELVPYPGTQVETITGNTVTNVELNEIQE